MKPFLRRHLADWRLVFLYLLIALALEAAGFLLRPSHLTISVIALFLGSCLLGSVLGLKLVFYQDAKYLAHLCFDCMNQGYTVDEKLMIVVPCHCAGEAAVAAVTFEAAVAAGPRQRPSGLAQRA